jgi:hypothetical protein
MNQLIEKLNFNFDASELLDYYNTLQCSYQDYKWTYQDSQHQIKENFLNVYANVNAKKKSGYGWAITTNNPDKTVKKNIPWYNISKHYDHGITELPSERFTPMVFGIAQKILEKIPYARCMSISVFEPGTELVAHKDEPFLLRVHIPIKTTAKSYWLNTDGYSNLSVGEAYLCDTRESHSIHNDGVEDRVHLLFAIHQDYEDNIKKLKGTL